MQWLERVISGAWVSYRHEFPKIAVVMLFLWLPIDLLMTYLDSNVFGPDEFARSVRVARYLELFFGCVGAGAITAIVAAHVLGHQIGYYDPIDLAFSRWGRLIGVRLIAGLAIMGGLILLILPAIYIAVRVGLYDQAIIIEKVSSRQGVERSWQLTKGRFLPIASIYLVQIALTLTISLVAYFVVLPAGFDSPWISDTIVNLAIRLLEAFAISCFTIAYFEQAGRDAAEPALFGPVRQDRSIFDEH